MSLSSSSEPVDPSGPSSIVRLAIVGIPGAGKTTASRFLAEYFEVPYLHGSKIVMEACPGKWVERGDMAPEPDATLAIEAAVQANRQWILDGFPRSAFQLRTKHVRREAIVFLDVSTREATKRALARGRASKDIEVKRITEQSILLAPVRQLAAVVIPTTFRTPDQVNQMILDWFEREIHPNEHGSNAR